MQNNNELINLINIQFNEIKIQIKCEIANFYFATIPLKRLKLKHLFWNDYKIENLDFNDKKTRLMLLERILNYSPNVLKDLSKFDKNELKEFLYSYKPTFNKEFVNKRINILKRILFDDENVKVKELEWM